jgi:hypothetical protein
MSDERTEQRQRAKSLAPFIMIGNAIVIAFLCWIGGDDLPFELAAVILLAAFELGIFAWVLLRK